MKLKHVYDPVNRQNYYGALGAKPEALKRAVKKFTGVSIDDMTFNGRGKSFYIDTAEGRLVFVWTRKAKDYPVLVHETVHAVAFSLTRLGYAFDEDQEVYSYSAEFIFRSLTGGIQFSYKIKK
jgi:hypothetical protein